VGGIPFDRKGIEDWTGDGDREKETEPIRHMTITAGGEKPKSLLGLEGR